MQPEDEARLTGCPGVVRDAAEILEGMLKSKHLARQNPVTHLAA